MATFKTQSFMGQIRKVLPFHKSTNEKEEKLSYFSKNGSLILEELIATFGGRYKLPVRSFTAKELIRATNNFAEKVQHMGDNGYAFRGKLEERLVLVKVYSTGLSCSRSEMSESAEKEAIRDIVITSQMSHLKNVLNLIGCSLEFEYPAMVYEYAGTEILSKYLYLRNDRKLLSWRSRIKIASDVANVITYLHTAFPTPIIYRNLTPHKLIMDQYGTCKLFDFTISIPLPPGELQVEDSIKGTWRYMDPQYAISGIVTPKADVYSIGMLMLVLFTGKTATVLYLEGRQGQLSFRDYIKSCLENNQFNQIVDPKILQEEGDNDLRQNSLDFLGLAFRCTEYEGSDRPDMIDVAKELFQIEKSVRCS